MRDHDPTDLPRINGSEHSPVVGSALAGVFVREFLEISVGDGYGVSFDRTNLDGLVRITEG